MTTEEIAARIYDQATPEERARVILSLLGVEQDVERISAIGALIRSYGDAAASAQRERDAGIAEDYATGEYNGSDAAFVAKYGADTVAAAIRAQS